MNQLSLFMPEVTILLMLSLFLLQVTILRGGIQIWSVCEDYVSFGLKYRAISDSSGGICDNRSLSGLVRVGPWRCFFESCLYKN